MFSSSKSLRYFGGSSKFGNVVFPFLQQIENSFFGVTFFFIFFFFFFLFVFFYYFFIFINFFYFFFFFCYNCFWILQFVALVKSIVQIEFVILIENNNHLE